MFCAESSVVVFLSLGSYMYYSFSSLGFIHFLFITVSSHLILLLQIKLYGTG